MSLVDMIEQLGASVDAGLLDHDTAVHRLVQFSDGGLTPSGAVDMIRNWQTVRARCADLLMFAELRAAAWRDEQDRRGDGRA